MRMLILVAAGLTAFGCFLPAQAADAKWRCGPSLKTPKPASIRITR